jgi:uncharacterized membrane protein YqaE (UPF0057 family)
LVNRHWKYFLTSSIVINLCLSCVYYAGIYCPVSQWLRRGFGLANRLLDLH